MAVDVLGHAETPRPDQLAVEIERGEVAVGEHGVDAAAVGGDRRRGVAGVLHHLRRLGGALGRAGNRLAPEQLAVLGVESVDLAASSVAPVRNTRSPQTTGELLPGSGTGVFQTMPLPEAASHAVGKFV